MNKYFGYVRVSTKKQGEGVSLKAQRAAIRAYAKKNKLNISRWFEEQETAAKSGRPIFNGMIKTLRCGRASGLIMHKIDRSARNFADWAKVGEMSDAGIEVHFATESLDFRSRGGRLSADIQAVLAADYIRNLREEILKGINGRLQEGLYPFRAPIGYVDKGKGKAKTPHPLKAPLITQAFELYDSGQYSFRSLQQELKRLGLRNRNGQSLSLCGLETLLGNPFYCGIIRIKKTGRTYAGIHQPIISQALFKRVQERRQGRCGKKLTRHNHLYRGLFRCGYCMEAMSPEKQKGHVYYRCHTPVCPTKTVREELIDDGVRRVLRSARLSREQITTLVSLFVSRQDRQTPQSTKQALKMQLVNVQTRLEKLTDALIERLIDEAAYTKRQEKLLFEEASLQEKLAELEQNQVNSQRLQNFLELLKNLVSNYIIAEPAEKRELVEMATSNRSVFGKNLTLQPANWLQGIETSLSVLFGADCNDTSRSRQLLVDKHSAELFRLIRGPEAQKMMAISQKISQPEKKWPEHVDTGFNQNGL